MANSTVKDMTTGNPVRLILGFAVPMLFGLLFQQFYSMVDTVIVGNWIGIDALAAVGSTGSINFMVIGFCMGVCSGFTIPVAQRFGSKDYEGLRKFVGSAIWTAAAMAAVMTILVCVFCKDILVLMRTPEEIIDKAYSYIFVIFLGIPVTYLYNLVSGIIRALGDSRTPVYFLVLSALINIGLDILSVAVLGMGVEGPAWATVISQAISGILCLIYMKRKFEILHLSKEERKHDKHCIKTLLSIGLPMGFQYSITAIGSVVLQSSVNTLGSAYIAAVTSAMKVSMLFCCVFDALGATMATYAGQNAGAEKTDRITKGMIWANVIGIIFSVIACVVLIFFGRDIVSLFMEGDEKLILDSAHQLLIVNSSFYTFLTLVNVVRFCIQGMGYSTFAVFAGVCEMIARSAVGFGLVPLFGFNAVCFANPLAWIAADLFLVPAYIFCLKRLKKTIERNKTVEALKDSFEAGR